MFVSWFVGWLVSRSVSRSDCRSDSLPMLLSEHLFIISFLIISPHVCLFVSWLVHQSVGKPVGRSIVQSVGLFHFQWSYQSTCLVWIFVNIGTWFCIEIIIENIKNRHKIPKLFRVFVNITFSPIQKPWGKPWHKHCSADSKLARFQFVNTFVP